MQISSHRLLIALLAATAIIGLLFYHPKPASTEWCGDTYNGTSGYFCGGN